MAEGQYDNEKRGALFKAREKRSDRSPDYNGNCQIDGVEYWVSGWLKDSRNGKFLSLSFSKKDQQPAQSRRTRDTDDDDFLGGAPSGNSRASNTSERLTPAQVAEMGRQPGNGQSKPPQGNFDNFDDDIPF
ncbi:single strand DNA binding protein [Burkholderia phage Bm1]